MRGEQDQDIHSTMNRKENETNNPKKKRGKKTKTEHQTN
jgi:hypothetical protein